MTKIKLALLALIAVIHNANIVTELSMIFMVVYSVYLFWLIAGRR